MFRILGSIDAFNEKMGVNLTHHDVNWVYNCHKLTGQRYYLKTREPAVKLISYLPKSNKGMTKDYLIVLGEWHDDLHYPTREGTPGGVFRSRSIVLILKPPFLTDIFRAFFFFFNGFADKRATISNINLVNQPDLNKVLKAEVFLHSDGQLRATHLILGYNLIPSSFQAPKCVIKARDPHLHKINVVVLDFLITSPIPEGVLQVELPFRSTAEVEATPSQLIIKEEEEEEIVEVSDSEENYEVFSQS